MKQGEIRAAINLGKSFSGPEPTSGATPVSPNFTPTKDPNVVMGKYGVPITKEQFEFANKNGYAWKDFPAYADYVGGWARPISNPVSIHPYYRTYGGTPNISGGDIAILQAKYGDHPEIKKILTRNIAPNGETPMFGAADADIINSLILKEKNQAQMSSTPSGVMANNNK